MDFHIIGICYCGCGEEIIYERHHKHRGIPKYIHGHNMKGENNPHIGKVFSEERCKQISDSLMGIKKNLSNKQREEYRQRMLGNTYALGTKQSQKTKEKRRKSMIGKLSGENHPNYGKRGEESFNWKGGITSLYMQIRNCDKSAMWRTSIFQRDNFTCQECGDKTGHNLNAHHIETFSSLIKKNNITTLEDALLCSGLWDLNNGVTLCKKCHDKIQENK